jgi:hypothetical protein
MHLFNRKLITGILVCAGAGAAAPPPAEPPSPRPAVTITHFPGVTGVAVSPDGKLVVTAGVDGTARLWDPANGKQLRVLKGHEGRVTAVAFARDGSLVVTGAADGIVRLWDATKGDLLNQLRGHAGQIRVLAVSGDGRRIASGGFDKTVCLWDAADGSLLRQMRPYHYKPGDNPEEGVVETLALSPDGSVLATGHRLFDFHVHVWDANTGAELAKLEDENNHVAGVLFSPDGATLASVGTRGRDINLWETATWRLRRRLKFVRQPWESPGAFSPDGWRLLGGAGTGVTVWDLATGERAGSLTGGHRSRVCGIGYFPGGNRVATASLDGTAFVWDAGAYAHVPAPAPAEPLNASQLEQLWADLAVEDAAKSYEAIWALAAAPAQAVPLIVQRVQPDEPVNENQVRQWVRELDDENFRVRERATKELGRLGDAAEPFLRQAVADHPSVEVAQRVEVLLNSIAAPTLDADSLRAVRSLEVLERIGTPEARALLEKLGAGVTPSKVKRRAQAAAARLEKASSVRSGS